MTGLTRSNIAYDLTISPHRERISYVGGESMEFVFSSALYRNKFLERLEKNRNEVAQFLTKKLGVEVAIDLIADLKLYTTIEKRGFLLIDNNGIEVKCQKDLTLDGVIVTIKNYAD